VAVQRELFKAMRGVQKDKLSSTYRCPVNMGLSPTAKQNDKNHLCIFYYKHY